MWVSTSVPERNANASSVGSQVNVRITAPSSANESVSATGVKILPSTRWNVKIGMNATMMIAFENSTGCARSPSVRRSTPMRDCRSASDGPSFFTASRTINASTITTALSMMMPKSTAPSEIRFADTPRACIRMNANSSASGITLATMMAARQLVRNTISTPMTSAAPTARFSATVDTVWWTSFVRS